MARFFLEIKYDGTAYHGWQIQPNGVTVQQVIEEAFFKLFQTDIPITGSGRTDTGVHAFQQFAHFDITEHSFKFTIPELHYKLNRILPQDISITSIRRVNDDAHARFDAVKRTYQYHIHVLKDPFLISSSWWLQKMPDVNAMNDACKILLEYTDFACFSRSNSNAKTTLCHLVDASWSLTSDSRLLFEISANRFLRNMVRAIVGTMIEIGKSNLTNEDLRKIIESKNRSYAGESAPAHGLFLYSVEYPETIFIA